MKRAVRKAASSLLLVVGGMAMVHAAIASQIVDVFSGTQVGIAKGKAWSFKHDLTADGFLVGTDTITSAELVILLKDEEGKERYTVTVGEQVHKRSDVGRNTSLEWELEDDALADLSASGMLDVLISVQDCDKCDDDAFKFMSSKLKVDFKRSPPPLVRVPEASVPAPTTVPEPGTLSLLGLGLAGVAALNRRRTRRLGKTTYGDRHGS